MMGDEHLIRAVSVSQNKAAIERFDALESLERGQWLQENYAGLRTGEVTLGELP